MDIELDMVVDDLESMVGDEDGEMLGDAAPTATCSVVATCCS